LIPAALVARVREGAYDRVGGVAQDIDHCQDLALPESPRHQAWRHAHELAPGRIDQVGSELSRALKGAQALLRSEGDERSWSQFAKRLQQLCALLSRGVHCEQKWAEPEDSQPDISASERRRGLLLDGAGLSVLFL
jgi:hypothetical protein